MSRSGYVDNMGDDLAMGRWRAQVASATRGKRGQAMLRDLLTALDAMPGKALIANELEEEGGVCALGALGRMRGVDLKDVDPEDPEQVAALFDIAPQLAQEVVYENDECGWRETPEQRWTRMRAWVASQIREPRP